MMRRFQRWRLTKVGAHKPRGRGVDKHGAFTVLAIECRMARGSLHMKTKALSGWIVPALILLIAVMFNPKLGTPLVIGYIVYILWSKRSLLMTHFAVKKYRQGDMEGALTWYARAAAGRNAKPMVYLSYALVLLKAGDLDAAEENLASVAESELSEYDRNVLTAMGGLLKWKRGNPRRAAVDLKSLADEFKNPTLFGALGSLYLSEGMLDAALRHNSEADEIAHDDQIIRDNLARTYYLTGEVEKAEEIFDDLIDRAVHMPEPYLNKALILRSRDKTDEALSVVSRAMQYPYSHLSYFSREEIEGIIERIESAAE